MLPDNDFYMSDAFYKFAKEYALGKLTEAVSSTGIKVDAEGWLSSLLEPVVSCDITNSETRMSAIYQRLLVSCQNRRGMPNIINFDGNIEQFRKKLFQFKHLDVLDKYEESPEKVLDAFIGEVKLKAAGNRSWQSFAKSVIDGAKFLSNFEDIDKLKETIDFVKNHISDIWAVPALISSEIHGLGEVLACDFLKEIGYTDYAKPDDHMIYIISRIYGYKENLPYRDVLPKVIEMANCAGVTPFELDKLLWLIASGKYYGFIDGKQTIIKVRSRRNLSLRDEFLKSVYEHIRSKNKKIPITRMGK